MVVPNVIAPLPNLLVVSIVRSTRSNVIVRFVPRKSTAPLVAISPVSVVSPEPKRVMVVNGVIRPIAPSAIAPDALLMVMPYAPFSSPTESEAPDDEISVRSPPDRVTAPI